MIRIKTLSDYDHFHEQMLACSACHGKQGQLCKHCQIVDRKIVEFENRFKKAGGK